MTYFLIIIIAIMLFYIALLTPEKRHRRKIKRIQNIFNTSLYPNAEEFSLLDERNNTKPNEIIKFGPRYMTRKEAKTRWEETKKKFPNFTEDQIKIIASTSI